jgi:hypothetical protein
MQFHLEIPDEVARLFASNPGGITRAALEGLASEGVRSGTLTVYHARQMLGFQSRYEMDAFLKARAVFLPITLDDVVEDSLTALNVAK